MCIQSTHFVSPEAGRCTHSERLSLWRISDIIEMQPAAGKKEITLCLRRDDGGEGDNDDIDDE